MKVRSITSWVFPSFFGTLASSWAYVTLAIVFGFAGFANAWATRGRHFGWVGMSAVVALAVAGY